MVVAVGGSASGLVGWCMTARRLRPQRHAETVKNQDADALRASHLRTSDSSKYLR